MPLHTQLLDCDDGAPRRARLWTGDIVGGIVGHSERWRADVVADAVQCASELVTAALIAGSTTMTLRLLSGSGFFRMSLVDDSATDRFDPGLRAQMMGLRLVEALADRWGIAPASDGREIWAMFTQS
jgi:hypothetical protein